MPDVFVGLEGTVPVPSSAYNTEPVFEFGMNGYALHHNNPPKVELHVVDKFMPMLIKPTAVVYAQVVF
jgi:hypothetical protein